MKVIGDTDCPHCKKSHEAEIDLENIELPKQEIPAVRVKEIRGAQQSQVLEEKPEPPQPQTKIKIPGDIPKYKCKNCDKLHDNPDYEKRPRFKCDNCGKLNSGPYCTQCTKGENFDELSDDELDDLGIPEPKHDHTHEAEE